LNYDIRKDIYKALDGMTLDDLEEFFDARIAGNQYTYLVIGDREQVDLDLLRGMGDFRELTLKEVFNY
jgi:hypothetical protein